MCLDDYLVMLMGLCVPVERLLVFFLMIRRPPRSTLDRSSAASDVYKRQSSHGEHATDNADQVDAVSRVE